MSTNVRDDGSVTRDFAIRVATDLGYDPMLVHEIHFTDSHVTVTELGRRRGIGEVITSHRILSDEQHDRRSVSGNRADRTAAAMRADSKEA